MDHSADE
jgi:cytochrome c oxidase assembly protein subunit 20